MPLVNYDLVQRYSKEALQKVISEVEEKELDSCLKDLISEAARFENFQLLINLYEIDKDFAEHGRGVADKTLQRFRLLTPKSAYELMTLIEVLGITFEKYFSSGEEVNKDLHIFYQDYHAVWIKGDSFKSDMHTMLRDFVKMQWFLAAKQGHIKFMTALKEYRIASGAKFNKETVYQPDLESKMAGGPPGGIAPAPEADNSMPQGVDAMLTFSNGERIIAGTGSHRDGMGVSRTTVNRQGEHASIQSIDPHKFFGNRHVNQVGQSILSLQATDGSGRNALHHAVEGGQAAAVRFLLEECQLDPKATDQDVVNPETPLDVRKRILGEDPNFASDPILILLGYKPVKQAAVEVSDVAKTQQKLATAKSVLHLAIKGKGNFALLRAGIKSLTEINNEVGMREALAFFNSVDNVAEQANFKRLLVDAENPAKHTSKQGVEFAKQLKTQLR